MKSKEWPPKDAVTELLKLLRASTAPEFRLAMSADLKQARKRYQLLAANRQPIPRKAYDGVAKAARVLNAAMNNLNDCYSRRGDDWLTDRETAQAEVRRILAGAEERAREVKRRQPPKTEKDAVVFFALRWLDQRGLSRAAWLDFIELYYETATGESEARGKLDHQIRKLTGKGRGSAAASGKGVASATGQAIGRATAAASGRGAANAVGQAIRRV
jgi:hypothetical protein